MRRLSLLVCSALLLSLAACGSKDDGIPDLPKNISGGGAAGGGDQPPAATATVTGKISFEGEVPKAVKIQTTADPNCKQEIFPEGTVVKDGGLANVVVYISKGDVVGKNYAPPATPVLLDQHGCHYVPHALVIQVGQELQIKNSDETLHNIHMLTMNNDAFNQGQPTPMTSTHKFTKEEILMPVKCDVHGWMRAVIAVLSHPFGTVSGDGGKYELKVPAGKFEITAIHEKYGMQTAMVDVKDGDKTTLDFKFKASDEKSGN
jgi:hypothetical protein